MQTTNIIQFHLVFMASLRPSAPPPPHVPPPPFKRYLRASSENRLGLKCWSLELGSGGSGFREVVGGVEWGGGGRVGVWVWVWVGAKPFQDCSKPSRGLTKALLRLEPL